MKGDSQPSTATVAKLTQIEDGLRQDLESLVRKQMEASAVASRPGLTDQEARLQTLEVNMTELKHQNQKFESWFQGFGTKVNDQAQAVAGLQQTVQAQQQELSQFRSEVQVSVSQAVSSMQSSVSEQLATQLQGQMEQIQALFSEKKARTGLGHPGCSVGKQGTPYRWSELPKSRLFMLLLCWLVGLASGAQIRSSSHNTARFVEKASNGSPACEVCRFGEASHPGPDPLLLISTSNPSGLRGKEPHWGEWPPGIHCFSETQLSGMSFPATGRAMRSIAMSQHRDVRVLSGAPVPLRTTSQWAGGWSGVLQASDFPCRATQLNWPADLFATARVMGAQHFVAGTQVTVYTVYGYAPGPTWPDARQRTDAMLSFLSKEVILGGVGLRLIVGDFNHGCDSLDEFQLWRRFGWQEAQCFASTHWHQSSDPP